MTNPSTVEARAIVDGLLRGGVDEVVLAPGSRNGPLSIALAQAADAGRLRLHVRLDERSASFLALGLAKRLAAPVAVVCTSGTAAAHLHAAAYEATEAGVPLLLLTADRPPSLRGRGANQTIDQRVMFGPAVLAAFDAAVADTQPEAHWRGLVADALAAARGNATTAPGAVHVNLPFAEPLVPADGDTAWTAALPAPVPPRAPVEVARGSWARLWPAGGATPRGVVITSDPSQADDATALAEALGWPVLAEPGSGARRGPNAIAHYPALLADPALRADVVVTLGRFALSRSVAAYVRSAGRHVAVGRATVDPLGTAQVQLPRLPDVRRLAPTDPEWLARWQAADAAVPAPTGPRAWVAAALAAVQPGDLVWYGPSSVIRYAEAVAPAVDDEVLARMNRGTNGIDGVVSSAMGAALAHARTAPESLAVGIMGDLTFLHDVNGLLVPPDSAVPRLALVVLDSDGGRIFATLEQGADAFRPVFDRVYGTPHNRDLVAIAAAYGVHAVRVATEHDLVRELSAARARDGLSAIVIDDRG